MYSGTYTRGLVDQSRSNSNRFGLRHPSGYVFSLLDADFYTLAETAGYTLL